MFALIDHFTKGMKSFNMISLFFFFGFAVIKREHLAFGDSDAPDTQIQIRLGTSPVHGRLSYRDRLTFLEAGDVFTQANVNSGYLR